MNATTSPHRPRARQAIAIAAALVALAAMLPLLVAVGWAARVLLVAAVPLAIVLVLTSPRARRWLSGELSETASYRGLKLPSHVRLHPAHTWARMNPDRTVTVGADDLMQQAIGPADAIEPPTIGAFVQRGETLFHLRRDGREIAARAPVSGYVVRTNPGLRRDPQLLNLSPYFAGWVAELEPARVLAPMRGLRRGARAVHAFCDDVDHFLRIAGDSPERAYAQDGGEVSRGIHADLDDTTWSRVRRTLFERD